MNTPKPTSVLFPSIMLTPMNRFLPLLVLLCLSAIYTNSAWAWGERGHDIVTRVAVRLLADQHQGQVNLIRPFVLREHMLAHLSNVPDIVWRANYMSEMDRRLNSPTHYFNFDRVYSLPNNLFELDTRFSALDIAARKKGLDAANNIGTAPWRIAQLHQLMTEAFLRADSANSQQEKIQATNEALLYGGLMSHFVADLANPHHTTIDHDGALTGNGGFHAYFESWILDSIPLGLSARVQEHAGIKFLETNLLLNYDQKAVDKILSDPLLLTFGLTIDSHRNLPILTAIDNSYSLIEKSTLARKMALRKPPSEVYGYYEDFVVNRLAVGATVLAQLWLLAWQQGGKPNLAMYASYDYPVKPEFIEPDYLN